MRTDQVSYILDEKKIQIIEQSFKLHRSSRSLARSFRIKVIQDSAGNLFGAPFRTNLYILVPSSRISSFN
jgi:hypothetical protein